MLHLHRLVEESLTQLKDASQYRELGAYNWQSTGNLIDLTQNDYLKLSNHPLFIRQCREAVNSLPVGSLASRLLGGEHPCFAQVEAAFSKFKNSESSLLFSSGFLANVAVANVLSEFVDTVFSDELNHASIIDGLRLARKMNRVIYKHLDLEDLEEKLASAPESLKAIYTESLFSMDGDRIDFDKLFELANHYNAVLVVDEAHSLGCLGLKGKGLASGEVITVNPCGKAFASQGAFVSGPRWWREAMINHARSFIYSTGISPWVAASLLIGTEIVPQMETQRARLDEVGRKISYELQALGFEIYSENSHILSIKCFGNERCVNFAALLREYGIFVKAIRYPTVAPGTERLRLSLHAGLSDHQIGRLIQCFKKVKDLG